MALSNYYSLSLTSIVIHSIIIERQQIFARSRRQGYSELGFFIARGLSALSGGGILSKNCEKKL